jgi:hypothetical protein
LNPEKTKAFRDALNNACGEINEAGLLSTEIFSAQDLQVVRRELARLMEIIDSRILARLPATPSEI